MDFARQISLGNLMKCVTKVYQGSAKPVGNDDVVNEPEDKDADRS